MHMCDILIAISIFLCILACCLLYFGTFSLKNIDQNLETNFTIKFYIIYNTYIYSIILLEFTLQCTYVGCVELDKAYSSARHMWYNCITDLSTAKTMS